MLRIAPERRCLNQAALSVSLSLSSVIRPAVCACASAAASAPPKLRARTNMILFGVVDKIPFGQTI